MSRTSVLAGALTLSLVTLGPVLAQTGTSRIDPPPEEPMARMMKMMDEMRGEMGHMKKQLEAMHGPGMSDMGGMQERMGRMMSRMHTMHTMMEQHRAEMQAHCPASSPPAKPGS
jgi:hypothetical protein